MKTYTPPNFYNTPDGFRDGFVIGEAFQQMQDGVIDITKDVTPEGVDFVRTMAADNDYEFTALKLEDGLTAVHLHRVG